MREITKNFKKKKKGFSRGGIEIFLLLVIIIAGVFLVGGLSEFTSSGPSDIPVENSDGSSYACCDTGNGDACKLTDKRITWKGTNSTPQEYALIKSDILAEKWGHMREAAAPDNVINGQKVFINITNELNPNGYPGDTNACNTPGQDFINEGGKCQGIPNDEIIYLCKTSCEKTVVEAGFDAYFRVSDGEIPDIIKKCSSSSAKAVGGSNPGKQKIIPPNEIQGNQLQLNTFKVVREASRAALWFSPYCKPAIYLYPENESKISVQVHPVGPFTYTDPVYPQDGWKVIAKPDGTIISKNKTYPYLYYEADIPTPLIKKPKEGFVIEGRNIEMFLNETLPKLGLNKKESQEMATYWQKALPKSPYYFIGILETSNLDFIAPLSISPEPNTVIRVSLYFEALEKKLNVQPPSLTKHGRNGFTVVEWGGILHTDKPFTCLQ